MPILLAGDMRQLRASASGDGLCVRLLRSFNLSYGGVPYHVRRSSRLQGVRGNQGALVVFRSGQCGYVRIFVNSTLLDFLKAPCGVLDKKQATVQWSDHVPLCLHPTPLSRLSKPHASGTCKPFAAIPFEAAVVLSFSKISVVVKNPACVPVLRGGLQID